MTDERGKTLSTVLWSVGIAAAVAAVIALSLLPSRGWAPVDAPAAKDGPGDLDAAADAWSGFQPVETMMVRAEDVVELVGLMTAETGKDNETPGAEPLPVRYVWCEDDGHAEDNLEDDDDDEPAADGLDDEVPAPADDIPPEPDPADDVWPPPVDPDEIDDPFEIDDLDDDAPRAPMLPFEQRTYRDDGAAEADVADDGLPPPPVPSGEKAEPDAELHAAVFVLNVPQSGTYYPWARVWWQDSCGDSLYVVLEREGAAAQEYVLQDGTHKSWHWLPVTGPVGLKLTAGDYRLTVRNREDGARLSRILLAPKDFRTYKPETPEG